MDDMDTLQRRLAELKASLEQVCSDPGALEAGFTEIGRLVQRISATHREKLEECDLHYKEQVEERAVVEEELRQQNEELFASRLGVEAQRRLYLDLFEFAPDGYLLTDTKGVIQEANRAAARLLEAKQEALPKKPLRLFLSKGDRAEFDRQVARLTGREIERLQDWDFTLDRNGRPLPSAAVVGAVYDKDRNVIALRWLIRDVSERRLAEATLAHERNFTASILETVGALVVVLDREGRIVRFNRTGERLTGYAFDEVRGKPFWEIFLPTDEAEGVMQVFRELQAGQFPSTHENDWYTRDGRRIRFAWANTALLNEGGEVEYIISTALDITERKRMEVELARQKELLQGIVDNIPVYLVIWDGRMQEFRFNKQFREEMGWAEADTRDGNFMAKVYPDPKYRREVEEFMQSLQPGFRDLKTTEKSGNVVDVAWANVHLSDDTFIGIGVNVTERKRAEAAILAANQQLQDQKEELEAANEELTVQEEELRVAYEELRDKQEALIESERSLKRAQEIAHMGGWELDVAHNRLVWSDEVYRIFGLPPKQFEATYDAFLEAVHPDDRAAVDAAYGGSLAEGSDGYEIEHRVVRRDTGEIRLVHEKCEHIRNKAGKIVRSIGMVHDVTERKQVQKELERLASYPRLNPKPIVEVDLQGGVKYLNPAAERLFPGLAEAGANHPILVDFEQLKDELMRSDDQILVREVRADGEWYHQTLNYLPEFGVMRAFMTDITDRKRAEEELARSRETYRKLFDEDLTANFQADAKGFITLCNPAFADTFGFPSPEAAQGVCLRDLYEDPAEFKKVLRALQENRVLAHHEAYRLRQDGSRIHIVENLIGRFDGDGKLIEISGFIYEDTERKRAEEAVKVSEERLRNVLESTTDGFLAIDRDWRYTYFNERGAQIIGMKREDLIGSVVWELFPAALESKFYTEYHRVMNTGQPAHFEEFYPDPLNLWLETHVYPADDGLAVYFRDITERRRAEEALRDSEARFRQLANAMPQLVWTAQPDGRVDYYNERYQEYEGIRRDENDSYHWGPVLHEDDLGPTLEAWKQALATGKEYRVEHRVRRSDGSYRWHLSRGIPARDGQGNIVKWFGTATDIHDVKQAQEALRHSEARLRATFDQAGVGIVETDAELRFIAVNDRVCEILGYEREELLGMTPHELTAPEDRDRSDDMNARLRSGELDRFTYEKRYLKRDGQPIWASVTVAAVRDSQGRHVHSIATIEDITGRKQAVAALEESEAFTRKVVDSSLNGLYIYDVEQKAITFINPQYTILTGYTLDEIRGMTGGKMLDLFHPDDRDRVADHIRAFRAAGDREMKEIEYRFLTREHGYIWCLSRETVFARNPDGSVRQYIGTFLDITERRQAEEDLRESEEMVRALADNIPQLAWMADAEGWIFWYNQRWFDYTGTTLEEMEGWGWQRVQHPDHVDRVSEKFRRHIEAGEVWEDIFPLRGQNGEYRWFLSRAVPITDTFGNVLRWFGTNTDVTEQREAEAALRQSETRFRRVVELSPMVIAIHQDGRMTYANPAALKIFGFDPNEEIIGRPVLDFIHPDSREVVRERLAKLYQGEDVPPLEEKFLRPDGATLDMEVYAAPMDYQGRPAVLVVAHDISDHKRAEELMRISLEQKTTLLKEIHHRIKNNLQIVNALLGLQAGKLQDEQGVAALKDSQARIHSIALVHEKLYRSSDLRHIDFSDYLRTLAAGLARTHNLEAQGITLSVEADPLELDIDTALPCSLVVNELVTNALKHAFPQGRGGQVRVIFRQADGVVHLAVADDGVGFPPDLNPRQSKSLGMQLVSSLAGQLSAKLNLTNLEGTCVELVFPLTSSGQTGSATAAL